MRGATLALKTLSFQKNIEEKNAQPQALMWATALIQNKSPP